MVDTILGTKGKMTQAFVNNKRVGVTVVAAGPCVVTQVKTQDKDGYWSLQLGLGSKRIKNVTKPMQGHLKGVTKENLTPRFLREIPMMDEPSEKVGDQIKASDNFAAGDTIQVTGVSKGKGFAGVVKRWKFAGGPKTHGQSDRHRAPGSIGQGTTPGRVWKGKRMAGRMGNDQTTVRNLKIVAVNSEKNEIHVSGPIPGVPGKLVMIKRTSAKQEPKQPEEVQQTE